MTGEERRQDPGAAVMARDLREGRVSARELVEAYLARIAADEPRLHCFAHLDPAHARAQAELADAARQAGRPLGPLHGVPVGIKDIFDTADYPTEHGSPIMAGRRPREDSAVAARLRAAGAIVLGKTVTTEFATFAPGPTRNPHDPARTPGGSAAAVAAGMMPLAVGSQTNGSVIRPASFCGVYGLKPTHGLISRRGCLLQSPTLDHVGVFARCLEDAALLVDVLAGHDPADRATRPSASSGLARGLHTGPSLPPRLAFVQGPAWEEAEPATREAFRELAQHLGDRLVAIDLPEPFAEANKVHRTVWTAELAHHLGPDLARAPELVSPQLTELLEDGRRVLALDYQGALAMRDLYNRALDEVFHEFDALLTPAAPGEAPQGLESTGSPAFCSLWTLCGTPAVSLPILEGPAGMPLGCQLVAARGDDLRLLRVADWLVGMVSEAAGEGR
ncbi:amidase [Marinimicrococcus flavescens]|uniref:Amidase n=1 Tax=Marinimicrococcus flavescens TaxID=3031815 RepID=A0AAP3V086_9PROT|nr:amidase [Marinimicrococcus flavescens]